MIATPLSEMTIGQWVEYWAKRIPDNECVVFSDRNFRLTWREMDERTDRLAKALMAIGIKQGSHVGIWATNVPNWVSIMYATAKIGAVLVTVNTNYKQDELEYLVKDADLDALFIIDGTWESDFVDMTYKMLPELREQPRGELHSERFPRMKTVIYMGSQKHRGMYTTSELFLLGETLPDDELIEAKKKVKCHDVVNMQYTSGTTGFPKGVMLTHFGIVNNGIAIGDNNFHFTPEDKLCICVPLFHCFGIVLSVMACLTHGSTIVMVEKFDPLVVLASIHRERCTAVNGVPTMFLAELNHPMFNVFDLTCLRTGIMAGSLCPRDLMDRVGKEMHMKVTSVYGLTESSPGMTQSTPEDTIEDRCNTVGRVFPHMEVKVVNPETGALCAPNEQGEICVKGYNVMVGYYNNEAATREAIDADGFLHSGDLGTVDERGFYKITGRIKDMIIRGGENIYPKEIETYLREMKGIDNVEVAGIPSEKYGEQVGAFIILKPGVEMTAEDVQDFCKGHIARYKIPKYVFFVDSYPLTGSGKIQKYKLGDIGLALCKRDGIEVI